MDIHIEKTEAAIIIAIRGELNAATTQTIQQDVMQAVQEGQHVLLDMSGVNYLSSAGLRMLLLLYRRIRENNGVMVLTGLSEEITDIMAITGFLDLFTTSEDRTQGLHTLQQAG